MMMMMMMLRGMGVPSRGAIDFGVSHDIVQLEAHDCSSANIVPPKHCCLHMGQHPKFRLTSVRMVCAIRPAAFDWTRAKSRRTASWGSSHVDQRRQKHMQVARVRMQPVSAAVQQRSAR